MGVKTIKGMDDHTWRTLKMLASKEDKSMADMLKKVVEEYTKNVDDKWHKILSMGRLVSDKESEKFMKEVTKMRKEYGFRI